MGGLNAVAYKGSLHTRYQRWTPAFQAGIRFQKRALWASQVSISFGQLTGEDRTYQVPSGTASDLRPVNRFQTNFFSLHYEMQFMLFRYKGWRLYASQGIGFFRFNPKDWDGNPLADRDKTRKPGETYNALTAQFPFHIGLYHFFPNQMAFGFQAGWLNVASNYLDNMDALSGNSRGDNVAAFRFQYFYPLH